LQVGAWTVSAAAAIRDEVRREGGAARAEYGRAGDLCGEVFGGNQSRDQEGGRGKAGEEEDGRRGKGESRRSDDAAGVFWLPGGGGRKRGTTDGAARRSEIGREYSGGFYEGRRLVRGQARRGW